MPLAFCVTNPKYNCRLTFDCFFFFVFSFFSVDVGDVDKACVDDGIGSLSVVALLYFSVLVLSLEDLFCARLFRVVFFGSSGTVEFSLSRPARSQLWSSISEVHI